MNLLIFDSGLGGLSVAKAVMALIPSANITYLADHAAFPYGNLSESEVQARVFYVIKQALVIDYDAVIIACNTASTICLPSLRAAFTPPFIGTVPAIKPACEATKTGLISVLATEGTIKRDYTKSLINEFSKGIEVNLVSSNSLATLAESYLIGEQIDEALLARELAPCFMEKNGNRPDHIVLACTHYPLLLPLLEKHSPFLVTFIDPAPAIARRVLAVVKNTTGEGKRQALTTGEMTVERQKAFKKMGF